MTSKSMLSCENLQVRNQLLVLLLVLINQSVTLMHCKPCTSTRRWEFPALANARNARSCNRDSQGWRRYYYCGSRGKAHRRALLRRSRGAAQPCQRVGSVCTARPGLVLLNSDCQPRVRVALLLVPAKASGKQSVRVRAKKEAASPGPCPAQAQTLPATYMY